MSETNACEFCGGPIRKVEDRWIHSDPDYDPFEKVHPPRPSDSAVPDWRITMNDQLRRSLAPDLPEPERLKVNPEPLAFKPIPECRVPAPSTQAMRAAIIGWSRARDEGTADYPADLPEGTET